MVKISVVLKKNDKYIVRKEFFEEDLFYGFWEVNSRNMNEESNDIQHVNSMFEELYGISICKTSFLTSVSNPKTRYDFYLSESDKEEPINFSSYEMVTEEQLISLNFIYPDALCRDKLVSSEKSLSQSEKDILIAADKLFNIRKNAARADTFIELMNNHITVSEFEEYMLSRIEAYKYGMPRFGFADDSETSLCIWKE
ncbi:MAG: hypothetical protein PHC31_03955 [Clostridia bacterium]|nr:hypothetical protein [Clostridia bacterium]